MKTLAEAARSTTADPDSESAVDTPVRYALIFAAFFLLAFLLHATGQNLWWNLLGGGDGYTAGLPSKIFATKLSPWNPYVQLGQYTFANTQFQPFYLPGLLVLSFFPNTFGYNLFILLHYALAGLFFYLFARNGALSRYAAFIGGLAFLSSGFLLAHKGHQAMMSTAIWLPLILFFCDRYAVSRQWRSAVYGGVAIAFSVLAGFPQITVYALMIMVPYLVFRCLQNRDWVPLRQRAGYAAAGLLIMGATAVLLSSLQLAAVAEALPYITRQKISFEMFSEDSLPAYHLFSLLIPNITGGFHGVPSYSENRNVVEVYPYMGLLPLAFALFSFRYLRRKRADVVFWCIVAALAALLSLGLRPMQEVLFRLPVYNLFRAPARHIFELNFAICVLAAFGVDVLFSARRVGVGLRAALRWTCLVLGSLWAVTFGVAQLTRSLALSLSSAAYDKIDNLPVMPGFDLATVEHLIIRNLDPRHASVLYPAIALVATGLFLLLFRRAPHVARIIMPVLMLADVWSVYHTIYDNPDTRALYTETGKYASAEVKFLSSDAKFDRTHYRIFPADPSVGETYPLLSMMHGFQTANDYTPMWLNRYQAVTRFALNGAAPLDILGEQNLLSSIGVQYLLAREPLLVNKIREARSDTPVSATPLPVAQLDCAILHCSLATFAEPDTIRLKSSGGDAVSIVNFPVELKPEVQYQVSFQARADGVVDGKPLVIDLYNVSPGSVYDASEQDRFVRSFGPRYNPYTVAVNAGKSPPEHAWLRLYTQSPMPLDIRNIKIEEALSVPPKAYSEVDSTGGVVIFRNPKAAPRFRFVTELLPASEPLDAYLALTENPKFDPARQAVVEGLPTALSVAPGRILSEDITNNEMEWRVETGSRSFLVVSDSWFPGWTATVDGREARIYPVNGFTRGLFVEGTGTHIIRMRFWPQSLTIGLVGTILGIGLLSFSAATARWGTPSWLRITRVPGD